MKGSQELSAEPEGGVVCLTGEGERLGKELEKRHSRCISKGESGHPRCRQEVPADPGGIQWLEGRSHRGEQLGIHADRRVRES